MSTDDLDEKALLLVRLEHFHAGSMVITVTGEVDSANSDDLRRQIAELVSDQAARTVALDLGELTFLGSAGIRALIDCHDLAASRGGRLEISRAHEHVREVLTICGLTDLFHLPA
ncbi:STAS domain-containing protein [Actinoplanes sp. TRM 88003]|uniref:Anti-sigma factor antagonist n=1 Tax=Paractinoplanes aksuensis TaxID=2939490 RepID=A0ABT1DSQ6_9ACTN|nr:STAS domain-containing protein [Actinoplanes aksuensis]MCO8273872.1 STAS domain-containing protein [Actinoplanes aksuensis]